MEQIEIICIVLNEFNAVLFRIIVERKLEMGDLTIELKGLLERAVCNNEIAGANLLILKDGKELVYTEAGYANIEEKRPFERNTISRIYSMTKPITSTAAMILMERGLLELGQPVSDIIEEFKNPMVWESGRLVPANKWILVKDLLNMTSGLSYGSDDAAGHQVWRILEDVDARLYGDNPASTMEIVKRLGKNGLSFHPGDKWLYGMSADVLGAVIEKVSGMQYGEFLKKEIFEPLGMEDTAFYVPKEKQKRLADVYERTADGLKLIKTNHLGIKYTMDIPPAFESGGAGLASTIDDYSKFATMLMQKGSYNGRQILSPRTVEYMTNGMLTPWQQETVWRSWDGMYGYGYGNLMRVMREPSMAQFMTWKDEYGWDGWLGTYFCNSPSNKVTILLTCQRKDAGTMDVTKRIRNVLAANINENV